MVGGLWSMASTNDRRIKTSTCTCLLSSCPPVREAGEEGNNCNFARRPRRWHVSSDASPSRGEAAAAAAALVGVLLAGIDAGVRTFEPHSVRLMFTAIVISYDTKCFVRIILSYESYKQPHDSRLCQ